MNKKLFLAMSRRRVSSPQTTQQIWDAIRITSYQRQIPDINRITRFMNRIHNVSEDEVSRQLGYCVRDGLVRHVKRIGCKGAKVGVEQESYRLPKPKVLPRDDHDWYCFECHSGGDVISCTSCHRVYHLACIEKELPEDDVKNKFVCGVCNMCKPSEDKLKMKRGQLNRLLTFTCTRLKEKLPATIMDRMVPSNTSFISDRTSSVHSHRRSSTTTDHSINWVMDEGDSWRISNLIFSPMDLQTMEKKAQKNKYRSLEQFQADAQTIVHNVVVYHGVHSPLADMARQMLRDCTYDLQEIRQCRDCYRMSNEKLDRHWFCQPCRPPHQLVYARQKGFPYWPAKVIKIENDAYDVRFFGGGHQRALIEKAYIRNISVNIHSLQVKRTSSWNKACDELRRHQELLEQKRQATDNFTNYESSEDDLDDDVDDDDDEEDASKLDKKSEDVDDEEEDLDEEEHEVPGIEVKVELIEGTSEPPSPSQDQDRPGAEASTSVTSPPPAATAKKESAATTPAATTPAAKPAPAPTPTPTTTPGKRGRKRKTPAKADKQVNGDSSISSTSKVRRKSKREGQSEEDVVTSSCEEPYNRSFATQTLKSPEPQRERASLSTASASTSTPTSKELNRAIKEALEAQRAEWEAEKSAMESEKQRATAAAVRSLEQDIARMQAEHSEVIADMEEKHKTHISEIKKKQWCYNCELEAIYHCCWNTAYCSTECQQQHWQKEHKRVCRRKR